MPNATIKVKQKHPKRLQKLLANAKESGGVVLAVGFPGNLVGGARYPVAYKIKYDRQGNPERVADPSKTPERVIDVAAANEFGADKTPARPFMKLSTPDANTYLHNKYRKSNFELSGGRVNKQQMLKFISKIAPEIEAIYDMRIVNLNEPANAPLTVKLKKSSNPLIDTGLMRQTLTYDIRKSKK